MDGQQQILAASYFLGFLATINILFAANHRKKADSILYVIAFILSIFWPIMVLDIMKGEFD